MKYLSLLLFVSLNVNANISAELCDEDDLEKLSAGISIPNCFNSRLGSAETRDEAICGTCKNKFEIAYTEAIPSLNKDKLKEEFLKIALEEYRKSTIQNLVDAIKIRGLPKTGSNFKESINKCSFKEENSFTKGCKNPENLNLLKGSALFKNLKSEMANELAKFVSTSADFHPNPTLLKRNQNQCFIREDQILLIQSSTIEEEFNPETNPGLADFLGSIDTSKYSSVDELFESPELKARYSNPSELMFGIQTHPILSNKFKDLESIKSFFSGYKPFTLNKFREKIYSQAEGDKIDLKLAESCDKSFKKLQEVVCSDDFKTGSLKLDPVTNYKRILGKDFASDRSQLSNTPELLGKNLELLKFCGDYSKESSPSLLSVSHEIGSNLESKYKDLSLADFTVEKYQAEVGSLNNTLCSGKCDPGSLNCKYIQKYNESKDPTTTAGKLANSSNLEVNSLLRSMIGDKTNLNTKTVEVLVAAGILPREDGTLVPQPDIPERRQDYFTNEVKRENIAAGRVQPVQSTARTGTAARRSDPSDNTYVQNQNTVVGSATETSTQNEGATESLADIEDEIRRRLSEIPRGVPQNRNQARSIVRQAARDKGRTITPAQENNIIDQMMDNVYSPQLPGFGRSIASTTTPSVSDTPTLAEKWKAGQRDEALAGMAGANQTSTSDIIDQATENTPKTLTTVALNIAEDPRITLSDIFNDKITRNDAETQLIKVLLRNRKDFVLRLNNMNFKVIFDQKNNFNVLLEPGTGEAALRYKPQLEIFLKRLKV